jgi:hypothetical protein
LPSASGGGGGHIDNPTHAGVLVVAGETTGLAGALDEALELGLVDGFGALGLGLEALGGAACSDPQAMTPAHAIEMTAINRSEPVGTDIEHANVSGTLRTRCRHRRDQARPGPSGPAQFRLRLLRP